MEGRIWLTAPQSWQYFQTHAVVVTPRLEGFDANRTRCCDQNVWEPYSTRTNWTFETAIATFLRSQTLIVICNKLIWRDCDLKNNVRFEFSSKTRFCSHQNSLDQSKAGHFHEDEVICLILITITIDAQMSIIMILLSLQKLFSPLSQLHQIPSSRVIFSNIP